MSQVQRPTAVPTETPPGTQGAAPATTRAGRLVALDAWRGLTIVVMWLVNNATLGAHTPTALMHAPWGGHLTLTDMVFPWFLFCAGAAIPYATAAAERAGVRGGALAWKLVRRAALLYLVGCFVTSVADHTFTLGFGVVQLIAVASLLAGLLQRLPVWARVALAFALLAVYEALFHFLPLPNGQVGVFQENLNAVDALNDAYLSPLGLKGLLSAVPTTALVLFGAVTADLIRAGRQVWVRLMGWGLLLAVLGYGLSLTPVLIEFNKAFWTPSYILYAGGLGTLGVLTFTLLERARWGRALLAPFTWPGRNALFAYVAPILFKTWVLQDWQVGWAGRAASIQDSLLTVWRAHLGSVAGGLLYTLAFIALWWAVTGIMARRKLIWKL